MGGGGGGKVAAKGDEASPYFRKRVKDALSDGFPETAGFLGNGMIINRRVSDLCCPRPSPYPASVLQAYFQIYPFPSPLGAEDGKSPPPPFIAKPSNPTGLANWGTDLFASGSVVQIRFLFFIVTNCSISCPVKSKEFALIAA